MTDPRFDPAFQRGYSGPQPKPVARGAAPSSSAEAAEPEPAASSATAAPVTEPAPESDPARPQLNPYRLALLLFGLALLLASVALLFEQVQHPQGVNTTIESQFVQILTYDLPPGLALAGFVCLIVWLALGALDRPAAPGKG